MDQTHSKDILYNMMIQMGNIHFKNNFMSYKIRKQVLSIWNNLYYKLCHFKYMAKMCLVDIYQREGLGPGKKIRVNKVYKIHLLATNKYHFDILAA